MVDITPGVAFLAALQNQFNAARQGQGQGTNSLIPGLPGGGEGDPGNVIGALGSGGISAGGVPGTATTGSSIANSLIGGGVGGDPLAQQVAASFGAGGSFGLGSREPNNPSGASLGEFDNLQGGDADLLKGVLSGNPLLMLALIGNAIANEGSIPSDPADLGGDFGAQAFSRSESSGRELGGNLGGSINTGSISGGGSVGNIRSGFSGGSSGNDRDQSPGPGPNRGTGPSNAGR